MSKHTPGPLAVQNNETTIYSAHPDMDEIVCDCAGRAIHASFFSDAPDRAEANARLLAAAYTSYDKHCSSRAVECAEGDLLGELLAACKAAAHRLESFLVCFDEEEIRDSFQELQDVCELLNHAIAKLS